MTANALVDVLALIPYDMQGRMEELERAVSGKLTTRAQTGAFIQCSRDRNYSVVLVPDSLPTHEWWSVWGQLTTMDPQPSILVYALSSDFPMWSGVLETGGFDVIVAPFAEAKLREAIMLAAEYFEQRSLGEGSPGQ
jgi:FixJ family two-component response regulator